MLYVCVCVSLVPGAAEGVKGMEGEGEGVEGMDVGCSLHTGHVTCSLWTVLG
jgi:hypothetical protein